MLHLKSFVFCGSGEGVFYYSVKYEHGYYFLFIVGLEILAKLTRKRMI
jgi:hypothetical protein